MDDDYVVLTGSGFVLLSEYCLEVQYFLGEIVQVVHIHTYDTQRRIVYLGETVVAV